MDSRYDVARKLVHHERRRRQRSGNTWGKSHAPASQFGLSRNTSNEDLQKVSQPAAFPGREVLYPWAQVKEGSLLAAPCDPEGEHWARHRYVRHVTGVLNTCTQDANSSCSSTFAFTSLARPPSALLVPRRELASNVMMSVRSVPAMHGRDKSRWPMGAWSKW